MGELDVCGCCEGLDASTPAPIDNPPGQPAVGYRAGVHATFKESLLARLSSSELPALAGLTARDDQDFTVALCDALAAALDVLTFYQERIANESYLRTALERRSILEQARLIGYKLAPGVAASTHLAFTLQEVPGRPELAAGPVEIPVGTRVQSVPGPGEDPQSFETVEVVEARAEWNAVPVQTTVPWQPTFGDTELWLAGTGVRVEGGDVLLVVGQERVDSPGSERWDVRVVASVDEDPVGQRTRVTWQGGLGRVTPHIEPAASGASVHVFRRRAALFGHNAPDPRLMSPTNTQLANLTQGTGAALAWKPAMFSIQGSTIDLDAAYPKVSAGSWVVLVSNDDTVNPSGLSGYVELYRASRVSYPSRTDFGLSGKVTRVVPDTGENLDSFRYRVREALVLTEAEPLAVSETPLRYPLYGSEVALGRLAPGVVAGRALAVSGPRARIRLGAGRPPATMPLDGGGSVQVQEGDSLRLAAPPERRQGAAWQALTAAQLGVLLASPGAATLRLRLLDRDDRAGTLTVPAASVELAAAEADDQPVAEVAFVGGLPTDVAQDRDRTTLTLASPLAHCYDREAARVNLNVAPATDGESVSEILGSGDSRVPNATFPLRQSPLTFVSAATPEGRSSTLAVRANDLLWAEVDRLFEAGPTDRVYELDVDSEGRASVRFGDGVEGARPPSGDANVRATYRKGLGLDGNVAAGKLTNLLSRPLGVTGATNPEPATGGEDAEQEDRARASAPLTVLTLDRAVSIRDYRDFARTFAGVAKAHALWVPGGPGAGVFLTVAGEQGAAVPAGSDTAANLLAALRLHGDPLVPLRLASHRDARFRLRLRVKVADDADGLVVLPAVEARLRERFGFEARAFGQGVSVDEVAAVVHEVAGVRAVAVVELHRTDRAPALVPRLFADLPVASLTALPEPAELLTLAAEPVRLEQLP